MTRRFRPLGSLVVWLTWLLLNGSVSVGHLLFGALLGLLLPALLGGLVVRVGDDKFDDSVARELELLLAAFAARGSRELPRIQEYIHNSEESSRGV